MARKSLTSLLPTTQPAAEQDRGDEPLAADEPAPLLSVVQDPPARTEAADPAGPAKQPAARARRAKPAEERVHYATLVRKEARLRDDQIEALAARARRLSRARTGTDVRITDNTLIRVAVDLLLDRADRLQGNTEAELRKSVGL